MCDRVQTNSIILYLHKHLDCYRYGFFFLLIHLRLLNTPQTNMGVTILQLYMFVYTTFMSITL